MPPTRDRVRSDFVDELLEALKGHSDRLSESVRQLGFAGIAIVWLFRSVQAPTVTLPLSFRGPLTVLIVALVLDLLHYIVGHLIYSHQMKGVDPDLTSVKDSEKGPTHVWVTRRSRFLIQRRGTAEEPVYRSVPVMILFWAKVGAIVVAYAWLLRILANSMTFA
jgi:hypothetical protein